MHANTSRVTSRAIGVEYEFGSRWSAQETADRLKEESRQDVRNAGVYTHRGLDHWKIVLNRSLAFTQPGFQGHGLVSPKLGGPDALVHIAKVLQAVEAMGRSVIVNRTCGHHVHFDASDLSVDDIKKIAISFYLHEQAFDLLMPPSRQANDNADFLRSHRASMNCRDDASARDLPHALELSRAPPLITDPRACTWL